MYHSRKFVERTEIKCYCNEDDQAIPGIESRHKENKGNDNVSNGRKYLENDEVQ